MKLSLPLPYPPCRISAHGRITAPNCFASACVFEGLIGSATRYLRRCLQMIRQIAFVALFLVAGARAQPVATYNETFAYEALHFAKVASCDSLDQIKAWTCPVCHAASDDFETAWAYESDHFDIQGFVGLDKSRKIIVIGFRGSKTLANWIANLKFARVDSPFKECNNCKVHKGFLDDYNSIADELFKAVNEIRSRTGITRVLITGHSLGAALALFAAVDLVIHDGFAQPVLYAFGLPRVGNQGGLGIGVWGFREYV